MVHHQKVYWHQCGHQWGSHPFSQSNSRRNSIQSRSEMKGSVNEQWTNFQSDMNKIRDATIKKIHDERAETQSRIQKAREQEISDVVKNPRKIEFEIESSSSKVAGRKYFQNNWEGRTTARGQEFSASVPKGELTGRAAREDKNYTEKPSPKIQKIDGPNYKIDSTRTLCRCSKKLEAPWRDRHNTDPGGKKERMLTELTELTGDSKRWKKMSSCAAWSELHMKSTIDEISGAWMGTNCDENATAPVAAKTQQQIDRNNGKRWDWETALLLLNTQTHYPPVGASCSANTAANWWGTRIKESSYFLCSKWRRPASQPIVRTN